MCLGVPGRIEKISTTEVIRLPDRVDLILRGGFVSFGGIVKEVNLTYVPEAVEGDYVLVHVGFAITRLKKDEADLIYQTLEEMGELGKLGD
ncbi:MAG: HypC/HybG/HupF family hydrogenase formation chaperone [Bdellovibrionales bacterium]|nr:HypC/HybG/HupF family hydrogenase formation chaperone [Bdellovibrionales bacterium]